jgi:formiminoglutamase
MLPILLSIPHGGRGIPKELEGRLVITAHDLFDDSDAFTLDIYDLHDEVKTVVKSEVYRAFVDMNRAPDELPPQSPDGVVKSVTCLNRPIYAQGYEPDAELTAILLKCYYNPFHAMLSEGFSDHAIKLALDCHSMLATAPPIEPTHGKPRPLFCLSNRNGESAPTELVMQLRAAIAYAFDIAIEDIGVNDPFQGGYITRRYGRSGTPIIQVEMNRCLYLERPWFDSDSLTVDPQRLSELRTRFHDALELLRI